MSINNSYDIYVQIEGLEQIRDEMDQINKLLTEAERLARPIENQVSF